MADMENFSEINQNFDTIKTLLNSIRAQGILNTSDVDKLLTGINSKLEKINTEEDIDLIKIFLSELKQGLDERHSVLISKFGAIESLFSNLLKNSSEMPKSADIKELFDIVATNLSVFSREVVSQKETLTDITLRLDALRSDDSQKKDIIKNIALLKPDLERLNNGFDSIVVSLNDNFKTIVKTITTIDKTEYLDRFAANLNNIEISSNTILSALQMLDKKAEQVDSSLQNLVTKDDMVSTNKRLVDINAQNQEIYSSITDISTRYARIDNLADKVDASVNIIVSLKSALEEATDERTNVLLEQLRGLELELQKVSSDTKFEDFKVSMEQVLQNITDNASLLDKNLLSNTQEIQKVISIIDSLDINVNFQSVLSAISKVEADVKISINEVSQKLAALQDANITRVLNDISTSADNLSSKLNSSQSEIAVLCEKNFGTVFANVRDLKELLGQIDENSVSANNAIFSSITDRLTLFENCLRTSLESQEKTLSDSSIQLAEQIDNLKNLSSVLDYKMDSSVVEVSNIKREFSTLQSAVEAVLALDFVNTVKDLRVDLYASKQELVNAFDSANSDLSEKISNDLYGKYELLISKLDAVEDEFKKSQASTLVDLKGILDKISNSIVDVLSYVSEINTVNNEGIDKKISEIAEVVKENSLDYVETVRDIVDVIRVQVENNIKTFSDENSSKLDTVKRSISENSEDLKKELKYSYSKLLEIQDSYLEIKEILNVNNSQSFDKFEGLMASTESVKSEFENKLNAFKASLLDKVSVFKQEFTCENTDNVSEIKFNIENFYNKNSKEINALIESLRTQIKELASEEVKSRESALTKVSEDFVAVKTLISELNDKSAATLVSKVDSILADFSSVKTLITELNDKSAETLIDKVNVILADFTSVKSILERVDENIDGDMTRQLSIIESNFESLVSQISILFDKSNKSLTDKINDEFSNVSEKMQELVTEKLENYKLIIEETFANVELKSAEHSKYIQDCIVNLNDILKSYWAEQAEENQKQIQSVAENLKNAIDENVKLTAVDYVALKNKLADFAKNVEANNEVLAQDLKAQIDDITKYIDSVLELQSQDNESKHEEVLSTVRTVGADVSALNQMVANNNNMLEDLSQLTREQHETMLDKNDIIISTTKTIESSTLENSVSLTNLKNDLILLKQQISESREVIDSIENKSAALKISMTEISADELSAISSYVESLSQNIDTTKQQVLLCKDLITDFVKKEFDLISKNVEKETDVIIAELIEQFDLLKQAQADDVVRLTSSMEDIVNAHFYNNIEDLKSYLDVKTDNSVLNSKLDNLGVEINSSVEEIITNLNKLLDANLFTTSLKDFRATNELLVNSSVDKINAKIDSFVAENGQQFEEKLAIFDKKFVDIVVDKFEEVKMISNNCNASFEEVQKSLSAVLTDIKATKDAISLRIDSIVDAIKESSDTTNKEIQSLCECFENLRSQISNKSFDEAFQASINKQVASLESLIKDQFVHLEEINDLCSINLPDVTELNTLVKDSIIVSLKEVSEKIDSNNVEEQLNQVKTEIVTQLLNVFNQLSFVAEQEEIIDFIQEKHDELISVLSHIVTSSAEIGEVRDNLTVVDNKINSLKDDIDSLNEKITSIISSEGDIDYVYSLQDLESDIANLRLVLNDMKSNDHGQEFSDLIASTNEIYSLVESIKTEIPNKADFDTLAEDIVSISSRTNKLLLSSDESYKTLQDNLQDFKLVINDLDERTRNFAQESGLDRIDTKLNAINNMMVNGAKTNQVFNQVFEYLAEWVDNASVQINSITDRVQSLDDISQIKLMLADLKAGSEDNTESVELIEALGAVFDKQAKRISSLETKLDKIIVETAINNKNNKLDTTPFENTLNRFLVAMDEKMSSQQSKIESLEAKLEGVMSLLDEKDTALLSKKVGGMDRQIAKLNKSIEKIASHVVEK